MAKLICLDFDGVLHLYLKPWAGATTIPDGPVAGAIEFIQALLADPRFEVAIFSSRTHHPGGRVAMLEWLVEHGLNPDEVRKLKWPQEKPPAALTIDDRAFTFVGTFPDLEFLAAFEPWNRRAVRAGTGRAWAIFKENSDEPLVSIGGPFFEELSLAEAALRGLLEDPVDPAEAEERSSYRVAEVSYTWSRMPGPPALPPEPSPS